MRHETLTTGGTTLAVLHLDSPADSPAGGPADAPDGTGLGDIRRQAEELLDTYGAVLLRGAGATDAEAFHAVVARFGDRLIDSYRGGNTPRAAVSDGVFTSTEYPARYDITLHNELSYAKTWPTRLFFGCFVAAATGGATPVCDGEALLAALPAGLRDRLAGGVVYHQHLHGGHGLGKSWQDTFETEDRAVVEEFLTDSDADFEWTAEGGLRVRQHRPAIRKNPRTGRDTWFNQADQWHPSNLPGDEGELLLSVTESVHDLPHWITYGDGSPLSDEDLAHMRRAQRENKLAEPWRVGDVMIVDNMSVLHGREAFTGERKVVVAMT
ncbi:TauD/TfdA family dioxygenase [Streptomyces sp. NPDC006645]|uniref:TauD/TfdA family dioxygenase n=1 Tax=unclassified Streptomyces TaxID=2593676 RepID=UPI0033B753C1